MPILGTKPNPIQIAVSLIAKLPKGGREWFYAISILGIVLLQGPEKRSQPTTKSERKVAFQGNNLRPVWCHVPSPTDARAVSNGRSKVHLLFAIV